MPNERHDHSGEENIERVIRIMADLGIRGEIIRHAQSGASTLQAESALGIPACSILKTLLLRAKEGDFVGAVILGNRRLALGNLEAASGLKRLRFASDEEVMQITTFAIGGVPPFALADKCAVYVDREVLAMSWVVGAAGTDHAGVRFNPACLLDIGYREAEIIKPGS